MNWRRIDTNLSFDDPETRFDFRSDNGDVEIAFRDWQNRQIVIRFTEVSHFAYGYLAPCAECAEGDFHCNDEFLLIERLRSCNMLGPDEVASHYLLTNNEDEWCEIVASSHTIAILA